MKFEKISKYADIEFALPERKTQYSAGYDMVVAEDTIIPPAVTLLMTLENHVNRKRIYTLNEIADITKATKTRPTLVPTGVKCQLDPDTYLELSVRSSCPLKYWLVMANSEGIIDADYYNNPDNEGHIYFQMINLGPVPIELKRGDIIGQGIIKKYLKVEDDVANGERTGGFGSTCQPY